MHTENLTLLRYKNMGDCVSVVNDGLVLPPSLSHTHTHTHTHIATLKRYRFASIFTDEILIAKLILAGQKQ